MGGASGGAAGRRDLRRERGRSDRERASGQMEESLSLALIQAAASLPAEAGSYCVCVRSEGGSDVITCLPSPAQPTTTTRVTFDLRDNQTHQGHCYQR